MNEVEVVVKARDETTRVFEDVVRRSKKHGENAGDGFSKGFSSKMLGGAGSILKTFDKIGEGINSALTKGLSKFGTAMPGFLGDAIGKLPPQGQAIAAVLVTGLAAALAPALGAAISSGVLLALGGGVLAGGIALVANNPKVKAAFGALKNSLLDQDTAPIEDKIKAAQERYAKAVALGSKNGIKSAKYDIVKARGELEDALSFNQKNLSLRDMAAPLIAPLERAAKTLTEGVNKLKPTIGDLFKIVAPIIDKLAPALVGFFDKMMPGVTKGVEAAVPLFNTLAEKLPSVGAALSDFFESISENGEDTNQFFSDLIDLISGTIIVLGDVISWMTSFYTETKDAISGVIEFWVGFGHVALEIISNTVHAWIAFMSIINPAAAKTLKAAGDKFDQFAARANGALDDIDKSVTVTARFKIVGMAAANAAVSVARSLHDMGYAHGGIVGAAATGGIRSGKTLVGERGPELIDLAPGSHVYSNADTGRMVTQAQGLLGSLNKGGTLWEDLSYKGQKDSGANELLADAFWSQHKGFDIGGNQKGKPQVTTELMKSWLSNFVNQNKSAAARTSTSSAGSNDGSPIIVQLIVDGRQLAEVLVDPMRKFVNQKFSGNVQKAYGR